MRERCRCSSLVFATPETTGVSRSSSNDLTYGTLPTGVDSPSLFRGARVCSTPISVTLARRTRIRLSFRGKLNGYRICGIRAFRPGGCFLRRSFRMENSVQGNHKHPPFPSSRIRWCPENNVGLLKFRWKSWDSSRSPVGKKRYEIDLFIFPRDNATESRFSIKSV